MTKTICIRYALVMIGMAVLTSVLAFVLGRFFGVQWPSGVNLALIFVTAMITGSYCYDKFEEMPDKNVMWKLAGYFTLIQFALAIAIMIFLVLVDPSVSSLLGQLGIFSWAMMILVAALFITLLNRFGFSFGISQARKKAELKKAKEQLVEKSDD